MVVNPFWMGVFTTISIEAVLIIAVAYYQYWRNKK